VNHAHTQFRAPTLEELLTAARERIQVSDAELTEARRRRDAIAAALRSEFPGARTYVNGSVAHGDALTPLADVDCGAVVDEPEYGPGLRGPHSLKVRAADAIRRELKADYGDLRVEVQGRKRSILVRFRDPVAPGRPDFTADVIIALDYPYGEGLWIPRWDSWDRSHPEKHTQMVLAAIESSSVTFARNVRLLKHYVRRHDNPLCSWNVKALALYCLATPHDQVTGLLTWFRYAAAELGERETPDPAGVAPHPIRIKSGLTHRQVARMLGEAADRLVRAVELERAGYPALAHDELAKLFNDEQMLPRPDQDLVRWEEASRIGAGQGGKTVGGLEAVPGVGAGASRWRPPVRSWAP
jgi:hypothetical protein